MKSFNTGTLKDFLKKNIIVLLLFLLFSVQLAVLAWLHEGVVSFQVVLYCVIILGVLLLNKVFTDYYIKKAAFILWQHQLFSFLRIVFLCWFSFSILQLVFQNSLNEQSQLVMLITILIGQFILSIDLLNVKRKMEPNEYLEIKTANKRESISIKPSEIIFIKSSENYCEIWREDNGEIKKAFVRASLKKISDQIPYSSIIRCHRSYIVNLDKVVDFEGNAESMKLYFADIDDPVKVSKRHVSKVKSVLEDKQLPERLFQSVK